MSEPTRGDYHGLMGFMGLAIFLAGMISLVGAIVSFAQAALTLNPAAATTAITLVGPFLMAFALAWGLLFIGFILDDRLR